MTYLNGDVYTGTWEGSKGEGNVAYADGSTYQVHSDCSICICNVHIRNTVINRYNLLQQEESKGEGNDESLSGD